MNVLAPTPRWNTADAAPTSRPAADEVQNHGIHVGRIIAALEEAEKEAGIRTGAAPAAGSNDLVGNAPAKDLLAHIRAIEEQGFRVRIASR